MSKTITADQARHLSPATVAQLYNVLAQCAYWFAGMPFTIQDDGIDPYEALEHAEQELEAHS